MTHAIRQTHRFASLALVLGIAANLVAYSQTNQPPPWVGATAAIPLVTLLVTGAYLFILPYTRPKPL